MHRADRWTPQIGILAPQPLPNFRRAPRRILPLQPNDLRFDDCGQLLGLPVRAAAAVRKGFSTVVSKAFEDLVTGLARDPDSLQRPAIFSPSSNRATNRTRSSTT